ncbi:MAG: PAS domain S-box protein [Planctomycetes bacterium]|nr:PAS domain S-box protein [Planctomycetota bacterium]
MNEQLQHQIRERKRLETKLQLASKRIQDILDSLFVFVGVFSTEGVLLEANRAPLEAANLNKSDVIGKSFWETYWWSYSIEIQKQVKHALELAATGETVRFETRVRLSENKLIDLDITFGPLYDTDGKITQLIASSVDITDRLIAEKNVAKKTIQLQAMLEINPNIFFHTDMKGTILGYEKGITNSLFPLSEKFIKKNIDEMLPQLIADRFQAAISEVSISKIPVSFEFTLIINHLEHWFQTHLLPFLSDEILVVIQDINQQKAAEIEMHNLHIRLFEAQRLAHIGSWEWNLRDNTLWWSEEVYCIFGLNASEFQPDFEASLRLIHPDDRNLVKRVIANTLKIDLPFSIEHRIIRSDGEIRHVHEQAALKKNLAGETLLMYGTIQDITEKYEANRMAQEYRDELAHVSRLAVMGELAAGLAHELNQPLTAIANYSSSMKNVIEQGGDLSELATKIEAQSLRSGEIVHRIKSLATKRKQQRYLFNIHDSIRSSIQLINYKIHLQQIQVKLVAENNFTTVYADRVQIEQVLVNLIKNAVEAMEETPLPRILTITTSTTAGSMILISVADTGSGIPDSFMDQLFMPFSTTKKEGLGIGLSLSRSLIDSSGGKMWYSPNTVGGATFHISLPAVQKGPEKI